MRDSHNAIGGVFITYEVKNALGDALVEIASRLKMSQSTYLVNLFCNFVVKNALFRTTNI